MYLEGTVLTVHFQGFTWRLATLLKDRGRRRPYWRFDSHRSLSCIALQLMNRVNGSGPLERSDGIDGAGALNDNDRPVLKAVDTGGGLAASSRRIMKVLLGVVDLNNNVRANMKSTLGAGGGTLRALLWCLLLGWVFSALIFTFVYVGFLSTSCSTITNVGNFTGDGEDTFQNSSVASLDDQTKMADHLTQLLKELQVSQEKQEQLIGAGRNDERRSYCGFPWELSYFHLLDCAVHAGRQNALQSQALEAAAPPRKVAFLFVARGELPLEPVWKRFLEGHEEFYSVYVHTHPKFAFPNNSFFYGHQVPSEAGKRFSITLVDAVRRLLAYAILDPLYGAQNSWFVLACEATIPIRSFNFTYNYLMESQHSFVESFFPDNRPIQWYDTATDDRVKEAVFAKEQLRKGEMWWAMELRHAFMVLEDWSVYYTYKRLCKYWCAPDEQYIPTLLGLKDPDGIENRTVAYVNWFPHHRASPWLHDASHLTAEWFEDIRGRTMDRDGQYHDTSRVSMTMGPEPRAIRSCYYNGVANSTCFLFARKVVGDAAQAIASLPESILGY